MNCFNVNGIKDAFDYNVYGLNGYTYQKVTNYNVYKKSIFLDLPSIANASSTPRRLKCVSSRNVIDLKRSHYVYCTLNQMSQKTEKFKMAKFFRCSPDDLVELP